MSLPYGCLCCQVEASTSDNHSFRVVLQSVACLSVMVNPQEGTP